MEKTRNNNGIWIFFAALILGICIVTAALIEALPHLLAVPSSTSTSSPTASPISPTVSTTLTVIDESFVEDKTEGKSPDFRKLIVSYDETTVYITIIFNSGVDQLSGADFIYMYGTHDDMIRLGNGSFSLERDGGGDGYFEEQVYSGPIKKIPTDAINIEIPREYLPDIAEKTVWGYSMQSQDRIPDEGELLLPDAVQ